MLRNACNYDMVSQLQLAILSVCYEVQLTGKVGDGDDKYRDIFVPNAGLIYVNPDLQGGVGATVSGIGMGEQFLFYYSSDSNVILQSSIWNYVARNIKFDVVNNVVNNVMEDISSAAFGNSSAMRDGNKPGKGNKNKKNKRDNGKTSNIIDGATPTGMFLRRGKEKKSEKARLTKPKSNDGSKRINVLSPNGLEMPSPFSDLQLVLKSSSVFKSQSKSAYSTLLNNFAVKLPDNILYSNYSSSMLQESVKQALTKLDYMFLNHTDLVKSLEVGNVCIKSEQLNFAERFPLVAAHAFKSTGGYVDRKAIHEVHRYEVIMDNLNFMTKQIGVRYGTSAPTSSSALLPYLRVITAAKGVGSDNPSITEESLRDIIQRSLHFSNKSIGGESSYEIIKLVILSIFGYLPTMEGLINDIMRDSWDFNSTALGYGISGSLMSYLDLTQNNIEQIVSLHKSTTNTRMVKDLAFYYVCALCAITKKPPMILIHNRLNEGFMTLGSLPLYNYNKRDEASSLDVAF